MYEFQKIKHNNIFNENTNDEMPNFQKEELSQITNFGFSSEQNCCNNQNKFLNNKRAEDTFMKKEKKHTKFSCDNLKRKCKHLVIENVMDFINNKIYEAYDGNIGIGLTTKKLMKLNQSQKTNADVDFNKKFLKMTLKEIFSINITKKIKLLDSEHNKNLIENIINDKKEQFQKLFNLTFIECVEHFAGDKEIEELRGLKLFSELKNEIIDKYETDGESYYENLKIFLKGFENKINKMKPRKKRKKNN